MNQCLICGEETELKPLIVEIDERKRISSENDSIVLSSFPASPIRCLEDQEELFGRSGDSGDSTRGGDVVGKASNLRLGLRIFIKCLEERFQDEQNESDSFNDKIEGLLSMEQGLSCCLNCYAALNEISRLQRVIEDTKASQLEQVETLKTSLEKSANELFRNSENSRFTEWLQIRDQLLNCLHQTKNAQPPSSRSQTSHSKSRPSSSQPPNSSRAPVHVTRSVSNSSRLSNQSLEDSPENGSTSTFEEPLKRKRKEIKIEQPDDWSPPPFNDNVEDSEDEDESSRKRRKADFPIRPKNYNPHSDSRDYYYGTMIYLIQDNLFLFKATIIQFSVSEQLLICQEPGCSFTAQGSDFGAFTKVKNHILRRHYTDKKYDKKPRKCPVCKPPMISLEAGRSFKFHLSKKHIRRPPPVLCETCGKTTLSVDHVMHQWTHKSLSEKNAAIKSNSDDVPSKLKKKLAQRKVAPPISKNPLKSEETPPKPKETPPKKKTGVGKGKSPRRRPLGTTKKANEPNYYMNSMFYLVTNTTLLYRCTLIRILEGGTKLKCLDPNCSKGFTTSSFGTDYFSMFQEIRIHIDTSHPYDKRRLTKATKKIKTEPVIPCPLCSDHLQDGYSLRYHLLKTHALVQVVCDSCWRPLKWAGSYRHHVWGHKSDEEKKADESGPPSIFQLSLIRDRINDSFLFLEKDNLLIQLFTTLKYSRNGENTEFTCLEQDCTYQVTGTGYQAFQNVRTHVESCHLHLLEYTTKARACPICPTTNFRDGRFLRRHIIQTHSGQCICPYCWSPVWYHLDNRHLLAHIQLHHPSNYEEENRKNLEFNRKRKWKKNVPKKERKLICPTCGIRFADRINLAKHEETHLPKHLRKKFDCPQCPDKFMSMRGVRNHVERIHQPELRTLIECPHCQKKFNRKDTTMYNAHLRTHTNEKPFVCDICGANFRSKGSLACHQECVHIEARFQCEFCEKSYKTIKNLKFHQKGSHPEIEIS